MMVPDSMLIAEISLFGEGFRDTRNLAKKVYTALCASVCVKLMAMYLNIVDNSPNGNSVDYNENNEYCIVSEHLKR